MECIAHHIEGFYQTLLYWSYINLSTGIPSCQQSNLGESCRKFPDSQHLSLDKNLQLISLNIISFYARKANLENAAM